MGRPVPCALQCERVRFPEVNTMWDWFKHNETAMEWLGALSLITFVASLVAVPMVVARIPEDYFVRPSDAEESFRHRHPAVRVLLLVAKNLLGVVLLLAGIMMLVVPGQGVLTILLGLMLISFPGKRKLELALIRSKGVLNAVNWMRSKAGRPALKVE